MEAYSKRRSRRSHPNLANLSITPLTTVPLAPTVLSPISPLSRSSSPHQATTPFTFDTSTSSYLTSKSLPQTPSILSRSSSQTRPRSRSRNLHFELTAASLDPEARSSSSASSKQIRPADIKRTRSAAAPSTTEWLLQTAAVLATQTAESKGQAWLVTRASSTSLAPLAVEHGEDNFVDGAKARRSLEVEELEEEDDLASVYPADDEFSPVSTRRGGSTTPRYGYGYGSSRAGSVGVSRIGSRAGSRRGSRVGLAGEYGFRTSMEEERGKRSSFEGVDFVDEEFEEDGDGEEELGVEEEDELRRLVWGRVGGWLDWAVGWMDWRQDWEEDRDEDGTVTRENIRDDERRRQDDGAEREAEAKEGKSIKTIRTREVRYTRTTDLKALEGELPPAPTEGGGVVGDARWLLGVASRLVSA